MRCNQEQKCLGHSEYAEGRAEHQYRAQLPALVRRITVAALPLHEETLVVQVQVPAVADLDALRMLVVERFLIGWDDGWIFRRALFYRGAIQEEDEREGARSLLLAMGARAAWLLVRRPEALTDGSTHPAWVLMYLMMVVSQLVFAAGYVLAPGGGA